MLALFVNGNHIGDLCEKYAYKMAEQLCEKVGDSAMVYTMDPYDHYILEECVRLYYRNSDGVQVSHNVRELDHYPIRWEDEEKEPTNTYKLRDKQYAKVRTSRTYMVGDHHYYGLGRPTYMAYLKRQEHKSARKLGKALIREQAA